MWIYTPDRLVVNLETGVYLHVSQWHSNYAIFLEPPGSTSRGTTHSPGAVPLTALEEQSKAQERLCSLFQRLTEQGAALDLNGAPGP